MNKNELYTTGVIVSGMNTFCDKCKTGLVKLYANNEGIYTRCGNCGNVETLPTINTVKHTATIKEDLEGLLEEQIKLSKTLFPKEDSNTYDGDVIFDEGRGQGIYETCIRIREFLKEY